MRAYLARAGFPAGGGRVAGQPPAPAGVARTTHGVGAPRAPAGAAVTRKAIAAQPLRRSWRASCAQTIFPRDVTAWRTSSSSLRGNFTRININVVQAGARGRRCRRIWCRMRWRTRSRTWTWTAAAPRVAAAMGVYRQMRECMVRTQDLASKMESTPEPRPYHSLAVRLRAQKSRLRQLERRCKAQFASLPGKHVAIARVLGATAEKSGAAPAQRFLVAWTRRHPLGEMHAHWNAAKDALLEHAPPINTSVENVALAGGGAMDARRIRAQRAYERAFHAGLRRRHAA